MHMYTYKEVAIYFAGCSSEAACPHLPLNALSLSPAPGKKSSSGYMDTVETACTGKSIARELSDIVVYLEPLKFFSFKVCVYMRVQVYTVCVSDLTSLCSACG